MAEQQNRIFSLDYLRGLAALGVMYFHYVTWIFDTTDSSLFSTKMGVYGVEIFYILSGLTLYLVYKNSDLNFKQFLPDFFSKRLFRIFPLLWITVILTIILKKLPIDFFQIFLNLTGLFGIIDRRSYIPQGAWSIGNELVFYLFFPFLLYLAKNKKAIFYIVLGLIFSIFIYYTFWIVTISKNLEDQWLDYINPFNQLFYFAAGITIGSIFHDKQINSSLNISLLLISLSIFIFYPVSGNRIFLTTGLTRILYTILSLLITFCFFKNKLALPNFIHSPLAKLGEISYSLYLLHPIVYVLFKRLHIIKKDGFPIWLEVGTYAFTIIVTFFLSNLIYSYYEVYFIKKRKSFMAYVTGSNS